MEVRLSQVKYIRAKYAMPRFRNVPYRAVWWCDIFLHRGGKVPKARLLGVKGLRAGGF